MARTPRVEPSAGQESVWDYPRPPRIERVDSRVAITLGGEVIVDTDDVVRVLETSHPPVYYLPVTAFADGSLSPAPGSSFCEFKGAARYVSVSGGEPESRRTAESVGWYYPTPSAGYGLLEGARRRLRRSDGLLHRRRRGGQPATGLVLRRLDNRERRGSVQGSSGHARLVSAHSPRSSRMSSEVNDWLNSSSSSSTDETSSAFRRASAMTFSSMVFSDTIR